MKFPPPVWEWEKRRDWEWDQDKENFIKMSNQAADMVRTFFLYRKLPSSVIFGSERLASSLVTFGSSPHFYFQMVDFTESTLESMLSTADIVRAVRSSSIPPFNLSSNFGKKLAEHRAAREREQQRMREQEEERRRNPPRLV